MRAMNSTVSLISVETISRSGTVKGFRKMLNNSSSTARTGGYYGLCAYRSDVIPPQKNQVEESNRTGLDRSASLRLPWGNTREVVPPTFMSDDPPKKLRRLEKKEDLADKLGLYVENSHECFRHAPLALQARFIDMMYVLGKVWGYIVSPIVLIVLILVSPLFEIGRAHV